MKLFNGSTSRTVSHNDNGVVYTLLPGSLSEVPDHIAPNILNAWHEVSNQGPASENTATEPWETRCGPIWEAAKKEFRIDLDKQIASSGPDRPVVTEPEVPADAINTETGTINDKLLNTHLCTYCQKEFTKIGLLRNHMKVDHNV